MDNPQQAEIAYLAGLFDGEGSITMYWANINNPKYAPQRKQRGTFQGNMNVTSTNTEVLELFKERFGGNINKRKAKYTTGKKTIYSWSRFGHGAKAALEILLPYLIIKKETAEDFIEYFSTIDHDQRWEIIHRYRSRAAAETERKDT